MEDMQGGAAEGLNLGWMLLFPVREVHNRDLGFRIHR